MSIQKGGNVEIELQMSKTSVRDEATGKVVKQNQANFLWVKVDVVKSEVFFGNIKSAITEIQSFFQITWVKMCF